MNLIISLSLSACFSFATEYLPTILRAVDADKRQALLDSGKVTRIHDNILSQLRSLVIIRYPQKPELATASWKDGLPKEVIEILKVEPGDYKTEDDVQQRFGRFVFYPWSGELIHLLPQKLFRELRLSNNRYLISEPEQDSLSKLNIGVVGVASGMNSWI